MTLPIKIELPKHFLDEETRCDYTITRQYKELWAIELDLLAEFNRVCKELGLTYYACAGTMLGAARHGGIIPWDDDIDVMMMRKDYEIICQNDFMFSDPYFFQTEFNDRGTMRGHAQLRNSKTTGILKFDKPGNYSFNQGIFIDIFPLDNIPNDPSEKERFIQRLKRKRTFMQRIRDIPTHKNASNSHFKNIARSIISPALVFVDKAFSLSHILYIDYENDMKRYNSQPTNEVGILSLLELGNRFIWNNSCFSGQTVDLPFEMMTIPVPYDYSKILEKSYGNWQEMRKEKSGHGELIFDVYNSYNNYIKSNQ